MIRLKSSTVGFKEWSLVCDALGAGRQSVILRKGGIAEGQGGFQWQASEFYLFPTHFHEQLQQTTWGGTPETLAAISDPATIAIRLVATIESTATITDWSMAAALAPFHIWKEEVIRERFGYGEAPGLSMALLRVHRLAEPWTLDMTPRFGGCRSWLDLPPPPPSETTPVLSDEVHRARLEAIAAALRG